MYHECLHSLNRAAASQHLLTSPAGFNFSVNAQWWRHQRVSAEKLEPAGDVSTCSLAVAWYSKRQHSRYINGLLALGYLRYSNTTVYYGIHKRSECIPVNCGVTNSIHYRRSCVDFTLEVRRMWLDVSTQAWTSQAWSATVGYETFTHCRLYCGDREKK